VLPHICIPISLARSPLRVRQQAANGVEKHGFAGVVGTREKGYILEIHRRIAERSVVVKPQLAKPHLALPTWKP
jgi:hypothetical protein